MIVFREEIPVSRYATLYTKRAAIAIAERRERCRPIKQIGAPACEGMKGDTNMPKESQGARMFWHPYKQSGLKPKFLTIDFDKLMLKC